MFLMNKSDSPLKGKVCWVTGCSAGIGEGVARGLAKRGATLVLSARNQDALTKLQKSLEDEPNCGGSLVVPMDVTSESSIEDAVQLVLSTYDAVDLVLHNAGIAQRCGAAEADIEVTRRIMEVNFFGPVKLTQLLLPSMRAAGGGQIGVVSSVCGKFPLTQGSAYSASKHACQGWFTGLALEERQNGIDVSIICPGFVKTDIDKNCLMKDAKPFGEKVANVQMGMEIEECAERIIKSLEKKDLESILYAVWFERAFAWLRFFLPRQFLNLSYYLYKEEVDAFKRPVPAATVEVTQAQKKDS